MKGRGLLIGVLAWLLAAPLYAQNPVSIAQVGTTPVTTAVPVSGTVSAQQSGNWLVQGLVAHDAGYSGNPLPLGCYASASAPSDVSADADIARVWCLRNGALAVNFTNTTIAVTNAGTFATQVSSSALPTGAATEATLAGVLTSTNFAAAFGTAGTADTQVMSVQGIASMTPVQVSQATASNLNATVVGTGTFATQAAQSGTWTVQPGNTANSTAWLVTGTGGVFPASQSGTWNITNVSGTVSLPTGASTLAEQQTQTTSLQLLDDAIATTGSAVPAKGVQITGTDGTNARAIKTDTSGELQVDVLTLPAKKQLFGTAQTVINTGTDIAASNFSGAPAASFDNTTDSLYPYATRAIAMIEIPDFGAAPTAGHTFDLYFCEENVDGTDDVTQCPSGTASGGATYKGSWVLSGDDALQRRQIIINIEGVLQAAPYVRNGSSQNSNNDGGTNLVVKITPLTSN